MRPLTGSFSSTLRLSWLKIPGGSRRACQLAMIGAAVGLVTVAFHYAVEWLFNHSIGYAAGLGVAGFLTVSFLVVVGASFLASLAVWRISPAAGGGGVMPTKLAFWRDFGAMPFRTAVAKFIGSTLTLGGGVSMGPEGPAIQIGAASASAMGGWIGVAKQERRALCACGAAAALAAAFNAPLAAILFVLEEIIGDLNSRLMSGILLAAVMGALVTHALVGAQPAYQVALLGETTWRGLLLSIAVAVVATLAGLLFQKGALGLRGALKKFHGPVPVWLTPVAGGVLSWAIGATVFLLCGHLGVFGIGYTDVTQAIGGDFALKTVLLLFAGKLLATAFAVGAGGCGGIFAPSFFIGAMGGAGVVALAGRFMTLSSSDAAMLVLVGMCSCLGAVIRTPLTCVLLIFEVTHQFSIIPLALLATLISQLLVRRIQPDGMYEEMIRQDGDNPDRVLPPRDYKHWKELHVGTIACYQPVCATKIDALSLTELLGRHGFTHFPVLDVDGKMFGILTRKSAERCLETGQPAEVQAPHWVAPGATLDDAQKLIIEGSADILCVGDPATGRLEGIVTLHDFLRAQRRLSDDAES